MTPPLTTHLLHHRLIAKPFALATTAPFLLAAGCGTLPAPTLCKWLVQDIHYARAYVRFVGGLIAKLRLGTGLGATTFGSRGLAGEGSVDEGQEGKVNGAEIGEGARANNAGRERERVMEKAFDLLVKALVNIQQEMRFFDDAVARYGLELQRKEMGGVMKGYADLFEKIGAQGDGGLLEGMVVLWGMEYCYLKAWNYARSHLRSPSLQPSDPPGSADDRAHAALREAFIPNWTCDAFVQFVEECGDVLDELARYEGVDVDVEGNEGLERCEEMWGQVIWLEEGFWPGMGN